MGSDTTTTIKLQVPADSKLACFAGRVVKIGAVLGVLMGLQEEWRARNPDRARDLNMSWRSRNPEKVRAYNARRYLKEDSI